MDISFTDTQCVRLRQIIDNNVPVTWEDRRTWNKVNAANELLTVRKTRLGVLCAPSLYHAPYLLLALKGRV